MTALPYLLLAFETTSRRQCLGNFFFLTFVCLETYCTPSFRTCYIYICFCLTCKNIVIVFLKLVTTLEIWSLHRLAYLSSKVFLFSLYKSVKATGEKWTSVWRPWQYSSASHNCSLTTEECNFCCYHCITNQPPI